MRNGSVGRSVTTGVGAKVGELVVVGRPVGTTVGDEVGCVGWAVGAADGVGVEIAGTCPYQLVGEIVGCDVGFVDCQVGRAVG